MMAPLRYLNAWIDHQRLHRRSAQVEWQLSFVLRCPVFLQPTCTGGGYDRIFRVLRTGRSHHPLASVRMNCPWRDKVPAEPLLPRIALPAQRRISRESRCYEKLAPLGIAPELIARGEYFLANQYLPWRRVSDVLRQSSASLWPVLPVILEAVRRMHAADVVHMDLNCGNLLISPDFRRVVMIDFEYAPKHDMLQFDQQRFDLLRLAHNLLKPRRGRDAAFRHPDRFIRIFREFAPESGFGVPDALPSSGFSRVLEHPEIAAAFQDLFGVFEEIPQSTPSEFV